MTEIELTDDQRQALQAEQGKLVDVVDPATQQRYVLLTREQFERICLVGEGSPPLAPVVESFPAVAASESKPLRQRIKDLPLPDEVGAEAKRYCKRLGWWGVKSQRQMEEQMKLQHFYGGKWIGFLRTGEGLVVVAAAESLSDPQFDQQLACLSPLERRSVLIDSPPRLFATESEILTPFSDEG